MIAEIYHKVSKNGSNLTEKLEDELTGNYFGNLRYLPFSRGLKLIFTNQVYSEYDEIKKALEKIDDEEWDVDFWRRSDLGLGEIDACIEFDTVIIGIEVKLYSGLSSADQILREAEMLNEWGRNKNKILIFIADEESCKAVYDSNVKKINSEVLFGYMSWQKAFEGLSKVKTENVYEKLIVSDLKSLLQEKGFEHFRGFDFENILLNDNHWKFNEDEMSFGFMTNIIFEGDGCFEFR